jgi:glyoxylase-like metal-dependent hydrolase (beta-lactamase superfamily II)
MTITIQHFPAGEHGFFRAPVLLTGDEEAVLVDGGFTFTDGRTVASAINASGKKLTTVYVSHSDPDYYFSLAPIRAAFPDARILAAPDTVAAINANVEKKLAVWGPKLGANGPQNLSDIVLPVASAEPRLSLDGQTIEIVEVSGLENRRYVWLPSRRAVLGGVLVFAGVHVWTADTATPEQRAAWRGALDVLAARSPEVVIPGHLAKGAAIDASAITYTRDYLRAFEAALGETEDAAALIESMKQRYPRADMGVALDIGAKVAKGELTWG